MKIAFFGTSDKSTPIMDNLSKNFNLDLCITKADNFIGRKKLTRETAVKIWSKQNQIDCYELHSIKEQKENLIRIIRQKNIELGIVADFSFMIPKDLIEAFKLGIINIHFSLLPKLRGASPVQHSILGGLKETGISYYLLDDKMDTGPILFQIPYKLNGTETTQQLYSILFDEAGKNLPNLIENYAKGEIKPAIQNEKEATYCYSKTNPKTTYILKEDALIDWRESPEYLERLVRAFNPWPIAWTYMGELQNNPTIHENIQLKENINPNLKVKIHEASLRDCKLAIGKLQVEGKNIIDWNSFVNGYAR